MAESGRMAEMIGHEHLLGFDARIVPVAWPETRASLYLLREDVRPRSADQTSWPSVLGESLPSFIGVFAPLWENLARLRAAVAAAPGRPSCEVVAVTVHSPSVDGLDRYFAEHCGVTNADETPFRPDPCSPPTRDPSWRCLGYDVIGTSGVSGLSNCGYDELERLALRRAWSSRIDESHLLPSLAAADEFRAVADERVREHAPFYAMGLWLVDPPA